MLIKKITNNFYQLTDVFDSDIISELVALYDEKDTWQVIPQDSDGLRLQSNISIDGIGNRIYRGLLPAVEIAETLVGKLYQNGPQLWYDAEPYKNAIHDGDVSPNHGVNIQVYLADGDKRMGTYCFDENKWHGVPYGYNCGYMLIGPTRVPHGMVRPVKGERLSLYQGFRHTEIPSNIW